MRGIPTLTNSVKASYCVCCSVQPSREHRRSSLLLTSSGEGKRNDKRAAKGIQTHASKSVREQSSFAFWNTLLVIIKSTAVAFWSCQPPWTGIRDSLYPLQLDFHSGTRKVPLKQHNLLYCNLCLPPCHPYISGRTAQSLLFHAAFCHD
jgi:hypothetical protein